MSDDEQRAARRDGRRQPAKDWVSLQLRQVQEVGRDNPRVRLRPVALPGGRTAVPLTTQPGGLQAYKMVVPATKNRPSLQVHEGDEWIYVLAGRLRLILGEQDLVLRAGEAAEFDTRVPHWFGGTGDGPAEFLSLFGRQGERMHVRAAPRRRHG